MSKYEWKKQDKELYLPKNTPSVIEVPKIKYFTIEGSGNPNGDNFEKAVETLYALSYAIRMMPKKGITPEGYYEYTVFPLEGFWDLDEEGRKLDYLDKSHFVYKLMIRQPDFINDELYSYALKTVGQNKPSLCLDTVSFEEIEEGLCVQMMHFGSYDDESQSFALMEKYCDMNNLARAAKTHKEIYISDPRRTSPEKLKTVLRFVVKVKD